MYSSILVSEIAVAAVHPWVKLNLLRGERALLSTGYLDSALTPRCGFV